MTTGAVELLVVGKELSNNAMVETSYTRVVFALGQDDGTITVYAKPYIEVQEENETGPLTTGPLAEAEEKALEIAYTVTENKIEIIIQSLDEYFDTPLTTTISLSVLDEKPVVDVKSPSEIYALQPIDTKYIADFDSEHDTCVFDEENNTITITCVENSSTTQSIGWIEGGGAVTAHCDEVTTSTVVIDLNEIVRASRQERYDEEGNLLGVRYSYFFQGENTTSREVTVCTVSEAPENEQYLDAYNAFVLEHSNREEVANEASIVLFVPVAQQQEAAPAGE